MKREVVNIYPSDISAALPKWFSWGDDGAPPEVVQASKQWLMDERNWARVDKDPNTWPQGIYPTKRKSHERP